MRSLLIATGLTVGASTPVSAEDSPFQAGNEVVGHLAISAVGVSGSRAWTIEGNNEPAGATAVWTALAPETSDSAGGLFTFRMPRQIRLNTTTAGAGSKEASLHLLGGT